MSDQLTNRKHWFKRRLEFCFICKFQRRRCIFSSLQRSHKQWMMRPAHENSPKRKHGLASQRRAVELEQQVGLRRAARDDDADLVRLGEDDRTHVLGVDAAPDVVAELARAGGQAQEDAAGRDPAAAALRRKHLVGLERDLVDAAKVVQDLGDERRVGGLVLRRHEHELEAAARIVLDGVDELALLEPLDLRAVRLLALVASLRDVQITAFAVLVGLVLFEELLDDLHKHFSPSLELDEDVILVLRIARAQADTLRTENEHRAELANRHADNHRAVGRVEEMNAVRRHDGKRREFVLAEDGAANVEFARLDEETIRADAISEHRGKMLRNSFEREVVTTITRIVVFGKRPGSF